MALSSFLQRFDEPATLKMAQMGRDLAAKGIEVINLSLGEPDFDTPQHIKDAAIAAINENYSHYTPVPGYMDARQAACFKLKRDNNLDYTPEQIVFSTGAKQSLINSILAIVDDGDEVVIPTPYWVTYSEQVKMARGAVVSVRTSAENGFKITPTELESVITDKTKAFMFSSPCNPSGAVYSKEELEGLAEVFRKFPNIYIIADEIYEYINFVGAHQSMAQFTDLKDRVILINGLSKGFAMTGWRVGYTASSIELAKAMIKIQGQETSATCSIAQKAAVAALTGDITPSQKMTEEFTKRRARVLELIAEIPDLKVFAPQGAFYVFPDISAYFGKSNGDYTINTAEDMTLYLLNVAHVSSVDGAAFGEPNCVRFSFAASLDNIEKAWKKIKAALDALQ
ncbi:MAG: aspartate aminotransferase [Pseudopedobacter saltans]|uniref:Aminotransferase n=1 Tax=Pseudopedobacter saltans TaxID=151895 RepID=A0A2W5ER62_9SPHI|nr:MAG: aspartate aminotransferase [Pseudopedobacter saltans]